VSMKHFSPRHRAAVAVAIIAIFLFFLRPGAQHLKARIANSVSQVLGRPVEIGQVHIRLLPRPGFDLENLVVEEDPSFGAEPMLRAQEVIALVRVTSLVRGRLDIARLELTEPSLNLVHRDDGHWNLEGLLERTAHTPLAPTAKSKTETRLGFPYIEASSGRINFKMGPEKKPYALVDADFSLWQESENSWGVRLRAQPVRTDVSLSDTGLLRMNGKWHRATSLRDTPLQFTLEWERAQLGQLSKLISGNDRGWRGSVQLDAVLQGTPGALRVSSDVSIQDFRRYDISSSTPLGLATHCDARYSSVDRVLHQVFCSAPFGNGVVNLHGDLGFPGTRIVDLSLDAQQVPVSVLTELARRAKRDLSPDLVATGSLQGSFTARTVATGGGMKYEGRGEIAGFHIVSGTESTVGKLEIGPETLPFAIESGANELHFRGTAMKVENTPAPDASTEARLRFGPFVVGLGRPEPVVAQGWIAHSGYSIDFGGEGEVSRALHLARMFGLPVLSTSAEGTAEINLQVAGSWMGWASGSPVGFTAPRVAGTAQLHNVRLELRGVNRPIEISSVEVKLSPNRVLVEKLNAAGGGTHWTGSLDLPRGCGVPSACLVRLNLNADEIDLSEVDQWLSPQPSERRWYDVLAPKTPPVPNFFQSLRAEGKISAAHLRLRDTVANDISASLELDRGKMKISALRADILGGKYRGEWICDFTVTPPHFAGNGTMAAISLAQAAKVMHDRWIDGMANGSFNIEASGSTSAEFWQTAEGTVDMDVRDSLLPHVSLNSDSGALRIERFEGQARLHDGKLELKDARLTSLENTFRVSGTVSLNREIDLRLARSPFSIPLSSASRGYTITGTLAQPRVVRVPLVETQAQLKP
jgi:hypothetical protein